MKFIFSFIIIGLLGTRQIKAQMPVLDSTFNRVLDADILLPKLIDSAIKYSPMVKRTFGSISVADENLSINKKNIYSGLALNSSYNYGTNYSAINNNTGVPINNFTISKSGFYNIGLGLQLPLTSIISRKHLIKSAEAQIVIAGADKDNAILYVKQEVIRLYQEFKLSYKLLLISGKNKEATKVNFSMAEKEFNQGQITVEEESRVMDIYNKSVIEYETYVNRFQTAFMQLESFAGTGIASLIKNGK